MYLGVDVGGTSIKFAVVDADLKIIHYETCPTPDNVNLKIVDEIYRISADIKKNFSYNYLGISAAGVIDTEKAEVISATDTIKNYIGVNFRDELSDRLGVAVCADNDVNCALLGEQLLGCAKGLKEVFCIALGTGIGGAYYLDKMPHGSCSSVGEIGQTMYNPKTGKNFEKRASTIALEKRIKREVHEKLSVKEFFAVCRYIEKDKKIEECQSCLELEKTIESMISQDKLKFMVDNHSEEIMKVLDEWLEDFSIGISNMLLILDPKYVVIGGAISKQGSYLIRKIEAKVKEIMPIKINKTKFLCASLGNNAAIYGAIYPYISEYSKKKL